MTLYKNESAIVMEKIVGTPVKEIFEGSKTSNYFKFKNLCEKIGENIAKLHNCKIIHGDLTSSNIMVKDEQLIFIDFGLGMISDLVEDKGVDLLVFKKAISAIQHTISEECINQSPWVSAMPMIMKQSVSKMMEIEGRGRYTDKIINVIMFP